jgi:hypothetical protein
MHRRLHAVHHPPAGHGEQQQVQLFERVGHPRQPPAGEPPLLRRDTGLRVCVPVVGVDDEFADRGVEFGQWQRRCGHGLAVGSVRDVAGQGGEEFGGEGAEEALDLAAALRHAGGGVHQPDPGVGAHLLEMGGGEVGAVVAVEHVRQPAHRPPRVGLAPDACRSANEVCSVDGSPRNTVYPATARLRSSRIVVSHGRTGVPAASRIIRSSSVWSACHTSFGRASSRR